MFIQQKLYNIDYGVGTYYLPTHCTQLIVWNLEAAAPVPDDSLSEERHF